MQLYNTKVETSLPDALMQLKSNTDKEYMEFMIAFDEFEYFIVFGSAYTKKDPANWGHNVKKYFIKREYCPCLSYDDFDDFVAALYEQDAMKYGERHIYEAVGQVVR